MSQPQFVLASSSPRRQALLEQFGVAFKAQAPDVDETQLPHETPAAMVDRVARLKAEAIDHALPVLAADTAVVVDGEVLGKPDDAAAAFDMLRRLAGRSHTVVTGVAVRTRRETMSRVVSADVEFTPMTKREIEWYVGTGEPLDKAGAYGLGGKGAAFVHRVAGDHTAVIGLPMPTAVDLLRRAGVRVAGG